MAKDLVEGFIVDVFKFPRDRLIWYDRDQADFIKYHLKEVYIADWYWTEENGME